MRSFWRACRYVHRAGRTGRAGESGSVVSLFMPKDELLQVSAGMLSTRWRHHWWWWLFL